MTHPVNWPKKTFFYPIGNTPPVCFTHDLAPEENAEILLLACGDPRSILYTVHADLAPGMFSPLLSPYPQKLMLERRIQKIRHYMLRLGTCRPR